MAAKKRPRKSRIRRSTSVIALCITAGVIIGIGLGALMGAFLTVLLISLLVGAGVGYLIDRRNGISYGRKR